MGQPGGSAKYDPGPDSHHSLGCADFDGMTERVGKVKLQSGFDIRPALGLQWGKSVQVFFC